MAESPVTRLVFTDSCADCGRREAGLPPPLPDVADDFDWALRDFDSFRRFMLQELVVRFPERQRWTAADLEVVIVEALAAVLDQLSDMLDRVAAEGALETARQPASVRRLLSLIGYDALALARARGEPPFDTSPAPDDTRDDRERFDQYWLDNPHAMDAARRAGPAAIHTQRRCVTLDDYRARLEAHPLVLQARARSRWEGAWHRIHVAVIGWQRRDLDRRGPLPAEVWPAVERTHRELGVALPRNDDQLTLRRVLRDYLESLRLAGQPVRLLGAVEVGLIIGLSIQVADNHFRSEVRDAVEAALGTGPGGFFEPGRLRFGEDVLAGDLFEVLMALDGVENVCLDRFKRMGERFPDRAGIGRIVLEGDEVAVCDNDPARPERGILQLRLRGGRVG